MPAYHEDPSQFPMDGGCACGLIRYRISQAPIIVHCCHCTSCQRETGTAFALNAFIESTSVEQLAPSKPMVPAGPTKDFPAVPALPEITTPFVDPATLAPASEDIPLRYAVIKRPEGAPSPQYIVLPSQSKKGQTVARCPRCYTCLWSHYGGGSGPAITVIRVGTLDEAWKVGPDVHIFTRSKRDFVKLDDGVKQFPAFYRSRKGVYREDAQERFAKLIPEIRAYHATMSKL